MANVKIETEMASVNPVRLAYLEDCERKQSEAFHKAYQPAAINLLRPMTIVTPAEGLTYEVVGTLVRNNGEVVYLAIFKRDGETKGQLIHVAYDEMHEDILESEGVQVS